MKVATVRGVGIGFRRELAHALLANPPAVDFVEVVVEACRDRRTLREAAALGELWPVVPHGVKLSLGSAEGIDVGRAKEMGFVARELRAPLVSEHVSFVRGGGREIGHLTELPMTRAAVKIVARNVDVLRRELPDVPLLLENVARAFVWPNEAHEMDEGSFYEEIVRATRCDLLLDVSNLYANSINAGRDPEAVLASFPLERVAMLHVAGGVTEHGFYFDTHAHPVPDAVFDLVAKAKSVIPHAAVLLERDAGLDAHAAILEEVARLRATSAAPMTAPRVSSIASTTPLDATVEEETLLRDGQLALAAALTSPEPSADPAIQRARSVLDRKRADDALPLLAELGPRIDSDAAMRLGRIHDVPRLSSMTAVADAMRIAEAACAVPELARAAQRDRAILHARFAGGIEAPRPRMWPCVVREPAPSGGALWAWKGFGKGAAVRLYERGAAG